MNSEGVDAAFEFARQRLVYHAVAFEPALAAKGFRHDCDPKMGLPAWPMPGMAGVLMGFIDHVKPAGREGSCQFFDNTVSCCHSVQVSACCLIE